MIKKEAPSVPGLIPCTRLVSGCSSTSMNFLLFQLSLAQTTRHGDLECSWNSWLYFGPDFWACSSVFAYLFALPNLIIAPDFRIASSPFCTVSPVVLTDSGLQYNYS